LQRAELFDDEEPQNQAGPAGAEEVLYPVPEAYAAQGSKVIEDFRLRISDFWQFNLQSKICDL
jgi:hypothetical protein